MARPNMRQEDPEQYEKIKAAQNNLKQQYFGGIKMARLCPYCNHKVEVLCRGEHASASTMCPNCREEIFFPPVMFRKAR